MSLTPKQQRFVDEYLVDLNATAAYRRAGYKAATENSAASAAARMLRNVKVSAAVEQKQAELAQKTAVSAQDVLRELALIGFSDVGQILDFTGAEPRLRPANEIPEAARRAISSVKVKRYVEGSGDSARDVEVTEFRLWPKNDALEKLGKHLGLFKDEPAAANAPTVLIIEVERPDGPTQIASTEPAADGAPLPPPGSGGETV